MSSRRVLGAVVAAFAALVLGGCASAPEITLPPAETTTRTPQKIIPLNGDIAEIIFALGLGAEVVATDTSATYPPDAVKLPKIGYQRQLNAEGILGFQPTIAIGTPEAGPTEVLDQVKAAGVKVTIIDAPKTLADVPTRIQAVADALGVSAKGKELADATAKTIADAKAKVPSGGTKPRVAFLYVRGTTTQMIGGSGSRGDAMIQAAGAIDAGVEAGVQGFKPITPEALAAAKPDVLLLLDAGLASVGGVDGLLALPGVAQTPAGAGKRIVSLEDQYLLGLGPRAGDALKDLVAKLYPA